MTTLNEMIEIIKAENPTIQIGDDEAGYTELNAQEYEAQISEWADARLAKEAIIDQLKADALAKSELLVRLGITEDEAKLLTS